MPPSPKPEPEKPDDDDKKEPDVKPEPQTPEEPKEKPDDKKEEPEEEQKKPEEEKDKPADDDVDKMADSLEEEFVLGFDPVIDIEDEVVVPYSEVEFLGMPFVEEEIVPTVVANEWNPDFFGRNPEFGYFEELDNAAYADRAAAVQSGDELMVLRTPNFSIAW